MQSVQCNPTGRELGESIRQPYSPLCVLCPASAFHWVNLIGTPEGKGTLTGVVHTESVIQGTKQSGHGEGKFMSKQSHSECVNASWAWI